MSFPMVVGSGIDLIEVMRIRRVLEDPKIGLRFRDRVYTEAEARYCEKKGRGKYESYAGRFAAKEAVMKALGSGWGRRLGWRDIEILPAPGGRPEVTLRDGAAALAGRLGIVRFSLSVTHTAQHAMAHVIAESE